MTASKEQKDAVQQAQEAQQEVERLYEEVERAEQAWEEAELAQVAQSCLYAHPRLNIWLAVSGPVCAFVSIYVSIPLSLFMSLYSFLYLSVPFFFCPNFVSVPNPVPVPSQARLGTCLIRALTCLSAPSFTLEPV